MSDMVAERRRQMFPKLTDAQIARIARHATRRSVAAGETLFKQGDLKVGLFVVLSGALEIAKPCMTGAVARVNGAVFSV